MAALTSDRNAPQRAGLTLSDPVAAAVVIYAGALYALDGAGLAVPATAGGNAARAVAQDRVDNASGPAEATHVEGRRGVWRFANSAGPDELTRTDIGHAAYVVDDQTVSKTGAALAGTVLDIEDGEVWVDVGVVPIAG